MTEISRYFIEDRKAKKVKRELGSRIETKKVHKQNIIVKKIKELHTQGKTVQDFTKQKNGMIVL